MLAILEVLWIICHILYLVVGIFSPFYVVCLFGVLYFLVYMLDFLVFVGLYLFMLGYIVCYCCCFSMLYTS